jgi:DNA-binding NarL/FixJ family response regulator
VGVRVVVVDDQPTIRLGLRMIVDHEDDMTVVGEAGTGADAVAVVTRTVPDVVLMDVRMPGGDGIEAVAAIRADAALAGTRALVLTTFDDQEYVAGALRAGAAGFLLKDADPGELVAAIRRVHQGGTLLDPGVTRSVVDAYLERVDVVRALRSPPAALAGLTGREREVLVAVAGGGSNHDVAAGLGLTEATVKSHVRSLLTKLGLTTRAQLVAAAYDTGLVRPAGPAGGSPADAGAPLP